MICVVNITNLVNVLHVKCITEQEFRVRPCQTNVNTTSHFNTRDQKILFVQTNFWQSTVLWMRCQRDFTDFYPDCLLCVYGKYPNECT